MRSLTLLSAVVALVAGCGTLPTNVERSHSTALRAPPESALARIAHDSQPAPELSGFRLLPLGVYSLDARLQLIQRSQQSLDVQYYLIQNDKTGRLLLRELRNSAQRGVRVRLLVDDFYTADTDPLLAGLAAFPNAEVRLFNPFCCARARLATRIGVSLHDFSRINRRMHNKLLIADGVMAIAGGRNIADEYFMRNLTENFLDMDAFVVGAVVPPLAAIFDRYWASPHAYPVESIVGAGPGDAERRADFDHRVDDGEQMMTLDVPPVDALGYGPIAEDLDHGRLGLIWAKAVAFADPPDKVTARSDDEARSMSVTMNVLDLVMAAKSEVTISSPYFVPGAMGVQTFSDLRKRDVKVTILTNSLGATDEPLVHTGYARYRVELLRVGVDLYELSPTRVRANKRLGPFGSSLGRLHAKVAVIDRSTVFVGSMNLDPRSATRNTELGIIIESPQLAREMLRVVHISKLQSAYRLRFGPDGQSLQWLTMDDEGEVILLTEPDSSLLLQLQTYLLAPFVPEQEL